MTFRTVTMVKIKLETNTIMLSGTIKKHNNLKKTSWFSPWEAATTEGAATPTKPYKITLL